MSKTARADQYVIGGHKGFERWLGKKRMSGPRKTIIAFFIKRLIVDARQQCWIRAKGKIDMTCLPRRGHILPTQRETPVARAWSFRPHCAITRCQHDQLTYTRTNNTDLKTP